MATAMRGRSLLKATDLSDGELMWMLDLSARLKREKAAGRRGDRLAGRNLALIFEKHSTRTRCAAAVAAADEGGHTEYLSGNDIHLGKKESVADTAKVLGRLFDGIMFRGYRQSTVEALAAHSGVPVWNGLTDAAHPTQTLADLLTVQECFGALRGLKLVYIGDGRNNVANSLMEGCAKAGMHAVNCTPPELNPEPALATWCRERATMNGGSFTVSADPLEAVRDAHVIYTDVWVSMGDEAQTTERIALLRPYQVTMELMEATGRLGAGEAIFLHCLPAFHDRETDASRESGALEVTDAVFQAPFSKVFDQAENRMHTIKAAFVASLASAEGRL